MLASVGADAKRSLRRQARTKELAAAETETQKAAGKASDAAALKELSAAKAEMKICHGGEKRAFVGRGGREELAAAKVTHRRAGRGRGGNGEAAGKASDAAALRKELSAARPR